MKIRQNRHEHVRIGTQKHHKSILLQWNLSILSFHKNIINLHKKSCWYVITLVTVKNINIYFMFVLFRNNMIFRLLYMTLYTVLHWKVTCICCHVLNLRTRWTGWYFTWEWSTNQTKDRKSDTAKWSTHTISHLYL